MANRDLYWDPFDYAIHRDTHPVWGRMMEEAPLYRNEVYDFWAVTRFDDVMDAICDAKRFSSSQGDILEIILAGGIGRGRFHHHDGIRPSRPCA